jgi:hypothetical protein
MGENDGHKRNEVMTGAHLSYSSAMSWRRPRFAANFGLFDPVYQAAGQSRNAYPVHASTSSHYLIAIFQAFGPRSMLGIDGPVSGRRGDELELVTDQPKLVNAPVGGSSRWWTMFGGGTGAREGIAVGSDSLD